MNWYIFAIVVLTGLAVVACVTAYSWGEYFGRHDALKFAKEADFELNKIAQDTAYNNGHRKGFQAGVDHQKCIVADRAREAARRDGCGRLKAK